MLQHQPRCFPVETFREAEQKLWEGQYFALVVTYLRQLLWYFSFVRLTSIQNIPDAFLTLSDSFPPSDVILTIKDMIPLPIQQIMISLRQNMILIKIRQNRLRNGIRRIPLLLNKQ